MKLRTTIKDLKPDYDASKEQLHKAAYLASEGIPKIRAMQKLTEKQFTYCCEFSQALQEAQCEEFDLLARHMTEAMKTMHDSMLLTMQLMQDHCDQQVKAANVSKTPVNKG